MSRECPSQLFPRPRAQDGWKVCLEGSFEFCLFQRIGSYGVSMERRNKTGRNFRLTNGCRRTSLMSGTNEYLNESSQEKELYMCNRYAVSRWFYQFFWVCTLA